MSARCMVTGATPGFGHRISHAHWTGRTRAVDTEGRIARFRRYAAV